MKGCVVVCNEYKKHFVREEYDVPDLAPGAILLRMKRSGICGSDLHTRRGDQINASLPSTGRISST